VTRPWHTIARAESESGALELRQRGDDDFLITVGGRVLMNSRAQRSELALASLGCAHLRGRRRPRVLVGGLGMGLTLRQALADLGPEARVTVAELNPAVVQWCAGPLHVLNGAALEDDRVHVEQADVALLIQEAGRASSDARFDAILLDLYEGPHAHTQARADPFYGSEALERTRAALQPGGVLAVWAEGPDRAFALRLRRAGFRTELSRPGRGGLRHAVYVATRG